MNYKISYLLKTPREISLEKAAEIIEVNTSEAIKQLTPLPNMWMIPVSV